MRKYLFLLLISLFALFFYKLDDAALLSYDEAWYAEITRNIVLTKNPLKLIYAGAVYTDHPPLGFIMMAIPTIIFGSNEFSTRFVSTLLGFGSVILIYLVGKKLNGKVTGITAAAVLLSSMWFMFRARSGNLDVPFVFFEILTIYFFLNKGKQNFFYGVISFTCLFLTKTLVGLGVLPPVLFLIIANHRGYNIKFYLKSLLTSLLIALPWYAYNHRLDPEFLRHHFITIGTRGDMNTFQSEAITNSLSYLAIGIGKWYKIFLVSFLTAFISFFFIKKQRKTIFTLALWFAGFSMFLVSSKTEIWHLIPLFPVIALFIGLVPDYLKKLSPIKTTVITYSLFIFFIALGIFQFNQFSNLIYTYQNNYSNEKDISIKSGKYENVNLVENFYPAALYYSKTNVFQFNLTGHAHRKMTESLLNKDNEIYIINRKTQDELDDADTPYTILESNDSYLLISALF